MRPGSVQREQAVADEQVCAVVRGLKRRRWGGPELFAYRAAGPDAAPGGHDVTAADINAYLREVSGGDFTAKDFRTWNATVLAAAPGRVPGRRDGRARPACRVGPAGAIVRVVQEVAGYLGRTPAVARASYIDPRVIERYEDGVTIRRVLSELGASTEFGELATEGRPEAAVLRLLGARRRAEAGPASGGLRQPLRTLRVAGHRAEVAPGGLEGRSPAASERTSRCRSMSDRSSSSSSPSSTPAAAPICDLVGTWPRNCRVATVS